uniref:Calcium/proton exchanger n=1 Tax=Ganoderma boninense TaxID=34458 RepID=A0A5K1K385_9APHY|nr:Calcium/proton exchanger [Ganoderma boninense]
MNSAAPVSSPEQPSPHQDKEKDKTNSGGEDSRSGISTIVEPAGDRLASIAEPDEEVDNAFHNIREGGKPDPFEVSMGPNDVDNPKSWSKTYRWYVTGLSAVLLLNATFASSAPTGLMPRLKSNLDSAGK